MSRFIRIPNKEGQIRLVNSDHIKIVSAEKLSVFIGMNDRYQTTITVDFGTDADVNDFIEKNFILFNA
jgi:hypothetical protein